MPYQKILSRKRNLNSAILDKARGNTQSKDDGFIAFYFKVLPDNPKEVSSDWAKYLTLISRQPKEPLKLTVAIGDQYHSIENEFELDLSNGSGEFAKWGAPYLEEEKRLIGDEQNKREAFKADSIAKLQAALDASDEILLPRSKLKDPELEKEILEFLKEDYEGIYEVYKVYIIRPEDSRTFWVRSIVKDKRSQLCYVIENIIYRENPYKGLCRI